MSRKHSYTSTVTWTGNNGQGTTRYDAYERSHTLSIQGKPDLLCSSDKPFRGDVSKYNPEDMLVASISSCHMLWYLHMCAEAGVIVTAYVDNPVGTLVQDADGGGRFEEVVLHPLVTVTDASMIARANELHEAAHKKCFIANSCNFPIKQEPKAVVG